MSEPPPDEHGFKRLSVDNWLTTDRLWDAVYMPSPYDNIGDAWVYQLVQVGLDEAVPLSVRKLFEVAKGTMAYGVLFYPLMTLGTEQLHRVLEAAVGAKCKMMDAPLLSNLSRQVDWLISRDVIPEADKDWWRHLVLLRNDASHPADQSIYPPGSTLRMLNSVTEDINDLFLVT